MKTTMRVALALLPIMLIASEVRAAGFEVGENTTLSIARGGTGAVLRRDPGALYLNPALLPRARGLQVLVDTNIVHQQVTFERDPLRYRTRLGEETREFERAENHGGPFVAPFFAASWDLGVEGLAVGVGVFGPSAYTGQCYGERDDGGECQSPPQLSTRYMMVGADLLQIYFTAGAGYAFKLGGGELSLGLSAMAAYQQMSFTLVADAKFPPGSPWDEDPANDALFRARDLTSWRPAGVLGVAWHKDGFHLGASYRPPIRWESTGRAEVTLPTNLSASFPDARLTRDEMTLRTSQAGTLRVGAGWTQGEHPGFATRPRLELEANVVYEDWSRVDIFEVETAGDIAITEGLDPIPLRTIQQQKQWQDTASLRLGGSYGIVPWLTGHAGAMLETSTQPVAYTNADFIAWQRRAVSLGGTFHVTPWLDVEIGYMFLGSPAREVRDGQVHQSIPLSACTGPSYDDPACSTPGRAPGTPQNEGRWTTMTQIGSVGLTLHLD